MCVLLATVCIFIGSPLSLLVFDVFVWFYMEHAQYAAVGDRTYRMLISDICVFCICMRSREREEEKQKGVGQ